MVMLSVDEVEKGETSGEEDKSSEEDISNLKENIKKFNGGL